MISSDQTRLNHVIIAWVKINIACRINAASDKIVDKRSFFLKITGNRKNALRESI